MRTVSDIMSRLPEVVSPETTVLEATRTAAAGDFCHLPVVDLSGLVGIVCICDLAAAGPAAEVGEYMTTPVETIAPSEPVAAAVERMNRIGIGSLPVVAGEEIVGIVTREDLRREGFELAGSDCAACGRHHHVWTDGGTSVCLECRDRAESLTAEDDVGIAD